MRIERKISPEVKVDFGWDKALSTFFGNVGPVLEEDEYCDDADLLLTVGWRWQEIESPEQLSEALAGFIVLTSEELKALAVDKEKNPSGNVPSAFYRAINGME